MRGGKKSRLNDSSLAICTPLGVDFVKPRFFACTIGRLKHCAVSRAGSAQVRYQAANQRLDRILAFANKANCWGNARQLNTTTGFSSHNSKSKEKKHPQMNRMASLQASDDLHHDTSVFIPQCSQAKTTVDHEEFACSYSRP